MNFVQVSIVDQRPEELIAAAALGVQVQYAAGLGPSGSASSLRASVESVQIDDDIRAPGAARLPAGAACRPACVIRKCSRTQFLSAVPCCSGVAACKASSQQP